MPPGFDLLERRRKMTKHLYRKRFEHAFEADDTAKGFHQNPGIDKLGQVEAYSRTEDGKFWVYVALEGEVDPDQLMTATGYEKVI